LAMRKFCFITGTVTLGVLCGGCIQDDVSQTIPPEPHAMATTTAPSPTPTAPATTTPPTPPIVITPTPAPSASTTPRDQLPRLSATRVAGGTAAPIAGGRLLVTADGTTVVAADPDRNVVFLVDLTTHAVRSVASQAGDELGRVVEGPA